MEPQILNVSKYTIYVPFLNNSNYQILIHGYTGAIDILKKDIATALKTGDFQLIDKNIIFKLKARGYLTQKTVDEEKLVVKNIAEKLKSLMHKSLFVFAVSYDCNLSCTYCFQKGGNKEKRLCTNTFTKKMVDKAYQAMLEIEPGRGKHKNEIVLYGGEPLMSGNLCIVRYIIKEGLKKGYKFIATTNGYDLEYFNEFLDDGSITEVQLTLDGLKESHNKTRVHPNNEGTYDKIIENIDLALKKKVIVRLRLHVTKDNMFELPELINQFKKKGFFKSRYFNPYFAIIKDFNCKENSKQAVSNVDFLDFYFEKAKYSIEFAKTGFNYFNIKDNITQAIKEDRCISFKPVNCDAHSNMKIFDPCGNIYNCWETLGIETQKIGSYKNEIQLDELKINNWESRVVTNIKQCKNCKYALLCGGGCAGFFARNGNSIFNSNCNEFSGVFRKIVNNVFSNEFSQRGI